MKTAESEKNISGEASRFRQYLPLKSLCRTGKAERQEYDIVLIASRKSEPLQAIPAFKKSVPNWKKRRSVEVQLII